MSEALVLETRVDDFRTDLTLNVAAKRNALSPALVEAVCAALDRAAASGVGMVLLRGQGPSFCAGLDLGNPAEQTDAGLLQRFVGIGMLLDRLAAAPFASVALVQGRCVGAGADLAMACDVRIALPDTHFSFPGAQFGLVLGTARLAQILGAPTAMRLALTGSAISAEELVELGALTLVASEESREEVVNDLAAKAERLPPGTVTALRAAADPRGTVSGLESLVRSVVSGRSVAQRVGIYADQSRVRSGRPSQHETTTRSENACRN